MKQKRKCDVCGKVYLADTRDLKRGWGFCCSKSCAAKKRELQRKEESRRVIYDGSRKSGRPWEFYQEERYCNDWADFDQWGDMELGIHD